MDVGNGFDKLTKDATLNDLPDDLRYIASVCGIEVALTLIKNFSGMSFNVPKKCLSKLVKKYALRNYDGTRESILQIAKACKVSDRYIRKIIKDHVVSGNKS